jgi:hypothetical protein
MGRRGKKSIATGIVDSVVQQLVHEVEADIERCLKRGYILIIGDGDCTLSLLVRSGVVEDEVSFLSYPSMVAVKKGSPQYLDIVRYICGVSKCIHPPDIVLAWGKGPWCRYETYTITAKGVEGEVARELARPLLGIAVRDTIDMMMELKKAGACKEEGECIEYMRARSMIVRGCE